MNTTNVEIVSNEVKNPIPLNINVPDKVRSPQINSKKVNIGNKYFNSDFGFSKMHHNDLYKSCTD